MKFVKGSKSRIVKNIFADINDRPWLKQVPKSKIGARYLWDKGENDGPEKASLAQLWSAGLVLHLIKQHGTRLSWGAEEAGYISDKPAGVGRGPERAPRASGLTGTA